MLDRITTNCIWAQILRRDPGFNVDQLERLDTPPMDPLILTPEDQTLKEMGLNPTSPEEQSELEGIDQSTIKACLQPNFDLVPDVDPSNKSLMSI